MFYVVMGVSGTGKSTIGELLAKRLELPYFEGDDFHPAENKKKMSSGIPLTDEDRWPWLKELSGVIREQSEGVMACSALKSTYRDILREGGEVTFVYLTGDLELLRERMGGREGHFMPMGLLDSQLETLEVPQDGIRVDVSGTPEEIVEEIWGGIED